MTPQHTTHTISTTGEVPVYCDCCPYRPKKMAVIQPDAIQIISRHSGKKHIAHIPIPHLPLPSQHSKSLRSSPYQVRVKL